MMFLIFTLIGLVSAAPSPLTSIISPSKAVLASQNTNSDFYTGYTCSQCIRGGHNYFEYPGRVQKCIEKGEKGEAEMRKLAKAGVTSKNLNTDTSLNVYQVCKGVYPSDKDNTYCPGTSDIKLDKDTKKYELNLRIPYNESCFYRVETACGWPNITVDTTLTSTALSGKDDFDIAAAVVDMTPINGEPPAGIDFPSPSYPFRSNETIISNTKNRAKTEIRFAGVIEEPKVKDCNNEVRRVMIVTISNFNNIPWKKPAVTDGHSEHDARSLQVSAVETQSLTVTFAFDDGTGKGAITLMMRSFFAMSAFFMIMFF